MAKCVQCGRQLPTFSFKKKCVWCLQHDAAQRGEVSEIQPVMARPWESSVASDAPVTTILLILNVMVFVAMVASGVSASHPAGEDLIRWGSNFGPDTLSGQYWRLFTHTFIHIGYFHLAMNMWFLYALGSQCERLLGSVTYTLMYVISGIAGGVASLLWHPYTNSAGASGALFGILGAMIAAYKFGEFSMPRALVQASLRSMLFCAGINLAWGLTGGIDNAAHIGGMIAGFLVGALVAKAAPDRSDFGRRGLALLLVAAAVAGAFWWVLNRSSSAVPPGLKYAKLLQQGNINGAISELERLVGKNPQDTQHRLLLASLYQRQGNESAALAQFKSVLTNGRKDDYGKAVASYFIVQSFASKKDYAGGEAFFAERVKNDPSEASAHQSLGYLADAQQHDEAAISEFRKAAEIDPKLFEAYAGLGRVYARQKRYDDAIAAYRKAIQLSAENDSDEDFGYREALESVEAEKQAAKPR